MKLCDYKCPHGHTFEAIDSPEWGAYSTKAFTCPECGWVTTLMKDFCDRFGPDGALRFHLMPDDETAREFAREAGRKMAERQNERFFELFTGAGK
jgi:hypothetical protein